MTPDAAVPVPVPQQLELLHWSRTPQAAAAAEEKEEAALWASQCAPGRSDWGLFSCQRSDAVTGGDVAAGVTAQGGTDKAQIFTYAMDPPKAGCENSIAVVKPISGAGTTLMHGNFARRVSPSLEALSWRVAMRRKIFKGKRVLELGAGLGLTGLAVGAWTDAIYVELTDGDPAVVSTLERSIDLNTAKFGETAVVAKLLHWDMSGALRKEEEQFDIIIAGDTVYLTDSHRAHLATIRRWLKPKGVVVMMASTRNGSRIWGVFHCIREKNVQSVPDSCELSALTMGQHWAGSLHKFIEQAKQCFPIVKSSTCYDRVVSDTFTKGKVKMKCFPVLVRLKFLAGQADDEERKPERLLLPNVGDRRARVLAARRGSRVHGYPEQLSAPAIGVGTSSEEEEEEQLLEEAADLATELEQVEVPVEQGHQTATAADDAGGRGTREAVAQATLAQFGREAAAVAQHDTQQLGVPDEPLFSPRQQGLPPPDGFTSRVVDVPIPKEALMVAKHWTYDTEDTPAAVESVCALQAESPSRIALEQARANLRSGDSTLGTSLRSLAPLKQPPAAATPVGFSQSWRDYAGTPVGFNATIGTHAAAAAATAFPLASRPPPVVRRAGPRVRKAGRCQPPSKPMSLDPYIAASTVPRANASNLNGESQWPSILAASNSWSDVRGGCSRQATIPGLRRQQHYNQRRQQRRLGSDPSLTRNRDDDERAQRRSGSYTEVSTQAPRTSIRFSGDF